MKQILITCDTEVGELAGDRDDAFEVFIKGMVNDKEVGVRLINNIASKYGAIVEHFVDIYPYEKYGEAKFQNLCKSIIEDGHKIGLHTHPSGRYDKHRKFMWQYSLEEQIEIVRFGKQKLKEWVDIEKLSHRAGGYGADINTIRALELNNIFVDSSYFYQNKNCKLEFKFINQSCLIGNVFEIPITSYEQYTAYSPFGFKRVSIKKLDFRYGSNVEDILNVIRKMPENCIVVLFLHSFNFLNLPYNFKTKKYGKISINQKLIDDYDALLNGISNMSKCKFSYSGDIDKNTIFDECIVRLDKKKTILKPLKQKIMNKLGSRGNI